MRRISLFIICILYMSKANSQNDTIVHSELPGISIIPRYDGTNTLTMSKSEFKRMPASFGDPTRVLLKQPGFSVANDGANGIVYHGLPPESIQWQLEGTRIVNPNHLSNAGTSDDVMTYNAGGTLSLAAAALGYFNFDGQPSDASNLSSWGGVANLNMIGKLPSFYELSLLGFEAGYGTTKNEKSTYVMARNSFVGVLGAMGVDFGGEKINFSDISFSTQLINKEKSQLSVFANLGASSNKRESIPLGDSIVRLRDAQNINYRAYHAIAGVKFKKAYNDGSSLVSNWTTSLRDDHRDEEVDINYTTLFNSPYFVDERKESFPISGNTMYSFSDKIGTVNIGLRSNWQKYTFYSSVGSSMPFVVEKKYNRFEAIPYVSYSARLAKQNITIGTAINSLRWKNDVLFQINSDLNKRWSYLLKSSYTHPSTFGFLDSPDESNVINASLYLRYKGNINASVIPFYMQGNNILQYSFLGSFFSQHTNVVNGFTDRRTSQLFFLFKDKLVPSVIRNMGIDTRINKDFIWSKNTLTIDVNASFFDLKYQPVKGEAFLDARYNYKKVINFCIYYQSQLSTNKSLSIGTTTHYRGGELYYDQENGIDYGKTFSPYLRQDLRIAYYYPSKRGNVHRWALDVQNVMNRNNDGYTTYNQVIDKFEIIRQLGLIPNLSYRLEF